MAKKLSKTKSLSKAVVPVNKGGRPLAIVNEAVVEDMAAEDYTIEEIAATARVHPDTIYSRFSETVKKGRLRGSGSIKHQLFLKGVVDKDTGTLIWLSKNRCGYREPQKLPEEATLIQFNVYVNEVPK
jgi:hypothetical protein